MAVHLPRLREEDPAPDPSLAGTGLLESPESVNLVQFLRRFIAQVNLLYVSFPPEGSCGR